MVLFFSIFLMSRGVRMGVGKHEKLKSFCPCNCWEKNKRVSRHSQALHGSRMGIHTRAENGISWLGLTQRANRGWTGAAAACGSLTLTGQLQGRVLSRYGDGFGGGRRPVIRSEEGYKLPGRDWESLQGTGNSHSALSRGFPRLPLPFVVVGNWQPSVTSGTAWHWILFSYMWDSGLPYLVLHLDCITRKSKFLR